jgi:hypothetical protein
VAVTGLKDVSLDWIGAFLSEDANNLVSSNHGKVRGILGNLRKPTQCRLGKSMDTVTLRHHCPEHVNLWPQKVEFAPYVLFNKTLSDQSQQHSMNGSSR